MLDDLKYIHQKDTSDALGVVEKQWQQLKQTYQVSTPSGSFKNVVLAGMGGSALAATMLQSCPGLNVPFEVVRGYSLPAYVNHDTLFIASSYSGNTEETLTALEEAEKHQASVVIIAAGGQLVDIAKAKNYPLYELPTDFQPRMAVFYNYAALIQLLGDLKLLAEDINQELDSAAEWLSGQVSSWRADVPTKDNKAKQLAQEIVGKSAVIYAGWLYAAAYKWKIDLNENAKNVAWCNQLPEFNHNEFLGWSSHPVDKPYTIIDLRSSLDHPQVIKRFEISAKLLSGKRPSPQVVEAEGNSRLQQLLWTITLGDFVSIYVALLNGLDPTPVVLIEKLKKELA